MKRDHHTGPSTLNRLHGSGAKSDAELSIDGGPNGGRPPPREEYKEKGVLGRPVKLVVEDDELALRRALWLAFDAAYKQALEQLAAKRAALQNKVVTEEVPDFSREKPVTALAPRPPLGQDLHTGNKGDTQTFGVFREFSAPDVQIVAGDGQNFVAATGRLTDQFLRGMCAHSIVVGVQAAVGMELSLEPALP